jgi:hypothetical protein
VGTLYPACLRGDAYLLAHNATAAATEFQKIVDHGGIVANCVTGSLTHLQIGRAHAMAGDCGQHGTEGQRVTSGELAESSGGTGVSGPISASEVASDALSVVGRLNSTYEAW